MKSIDDIIREALGATYVEAEQLSRRARFERDALLREEAMSEARGMRLAVSNIRKLLREAGLAEAARPLE
jgi:hypothetical protein